MASQPIPSIASGWPTISENRNVRFAMGFLLYFAQGLPMGVFFFAVPAWLAANGASTASIGLVATATGLPWSLKLINGFLMDRYAFLPMGRRRAWLIGAQTIIISGLVVLALTSPGVGDVAWIAGAAFLIMAATTYQDVAVDSMAIDLVPDEERGRVNGFMFGGQAIGIASGTFLTGTLLHTYGSTTAFMAIAGVVAIILCAATMVRERPGERRLPWTPGDASAESRAIQAEAWWPIIGRVAQILFRRDSLLLGFAGFTLGGIYGAIPALGAIMTTRLLDWNEAQFSQLSSSASLFAGLTGLALAGWLADRLGAKRFGLIVFASMITLWLAMIAIGAAWSSANVLIVFIVAAFVLDVMAAVATVPIFMRMCDPTIAATQFTIYMAIGNFGIAFAAAQLGWLEAVGGYQAIFVFLALLHTLGFAALWFARVGR